METQEKSKIIFKYPSKARPERFFKVIESIFNNISDNQAYKIICSFDKDDTTYFNKEFLLRLKKYIDKYPIEIYFNENKGKVSAINENLKNEKFNLLILINDWIEFKIKNFDIILSKQFNPYSGIVYFPSINSLGKTKYLLKAVSYEYFQNKGYIYNPIYKSNFYKEAEIFEKEIWINDNIHNNCPFKLIKFNSDKELFSYFHPDWYYQSPDKMLIHNLTYWNEDLKTFENQQKQR